MRGLIIPKDYNCGMGIRETEVAIKFIKDHFERELADRLNLTRVSAPLFVRPESGLNDNLNGVERPVSFDIPDGGAFCEIVHSLAKWKRLALWRYGFGENEGLYTDMNAIRRDETLDNLHSAYVDQWDWEKILPRSARHIGTLQTVVRSIYDAVLSTERRVCGRYSHLQPFLPPAVTFVTAQELEDRLPGMTAKEREYIAAKEAGAVFIIGIGGALASGVPHDGRAPDYDDWSLNGDLLLYYPVLDTAVEITSMGIRVDPEALYRQLELRGATDRLELPFQRMLAAGELPDTIGGGIGQSRLCMLFLHRAHVGEVQASVWPDGMAQACAANNMMLL